MSPPLASSVNPDVMTLRLYVAGDGPNSARAKGNLQRLRRERLKGCTVEVVDILEEPLRSLEDGIRLSPTLVRVAPEPKIFIAGDLRNPHDVLSMLGIQEESDE